MYKLSLDTNSVTESLVVSESHYGSVTESLGVVSESHYGSVTESHKPINEPIIEPTIEPNNPIVPFDTCLSFSQFWDMYDKKIGMKKCSDKYAKISESDRSIIKEHVPRYVASTTDKKFRKNPLTYLNGEHWNDEITTTGNSQQRLDNEYADLF